MALVIPSYEPDERLITLLQNIPQNYFCGVLVINDGSSSKYDSIFNRIKGLDFVTLLKHSVNLGKGRALKTAFNYALCKYDNFIGCVTADSDGQHSVTDIIKISEELKAFPSNLILGVRDFSNNNVPAKSKFGNNLTKNVCSFLYGLRISDTQTGLRGIPADFMKNCLSINGERFEYETNMLVASQNTFPIREIQIETIYDSKENHQTHFNPIKDSIKIYKIFALRLFSFLFSSLSSSLVDICLFWMFSRLFNTAFPTLYLSIATIVARVISATYNYTINYKVVFKSSEKHIIAILKYTGLACFIMLSSASLITMFNHLFPNRNIVFLKILIDITLFILSFIVQRSFVFRKVKK